MIAVRVRVVGLIGLIGLMGGPRGLELGNGIYYGTYLLMSGVPGVSSLFHLKIGICVCKILDAIGC